MLVNPCRLNNLPVIIVVTFVLYFLPFRWHYTPSYQSLVGHLPRIGYHSSTHNALTTARAYLEFWRALEFLLESNPPGVDRPKQNGNARSFYYNATEETERQQCLEMSDEEIQKMQNAHTQFVQGIKVNPPKLVYKPGTQGIVSAASGVSYLPLIVQQVRMLRRTGSRLPVEVYLRSNVEYESFVCEKALPSLNARCVILSEILDTIRHPVPVSGFQLKIFALLFSTFEKVLFIDADDMPIHDPEPLFRSEPFISRGYVVWPDFWTTTVSEYYYKISSQKTPNVTSRATSNGGEILVSKKMHHQSLLLAAYYNYYGPNHYYPLLSQGASGEGDKETFLAAAEALQAPYYATSERVVHIGHLFDGDLVGSAMVQYDVMEDYALTQKGFFRVIDPAVAPQPRPYFVHAYHPKFNPARIYDDRNLIYHGNGSSRRAWTDMKETIESLNREYDFEMRFWEELKWCSCHLEFMFQDWREEEDICGKATRYLDELKGNV